MQPYCTKNLTTHFPHTRRRASLCAYVQIHTCTLQQGKKKKEHAKILSFHSHTHTQTRPKTINTFLSLCLACVSGCTWPPDGRTGGRGGEGFFNHLHIPTPSVSTSCGGLNEITVIQIERREEKIQMLFSSSLLVTLPHSLPLSPLRITASPPHFPFLFYLHTGLASSGHVFTSFASLVGSFVTSVSKKSAFCYKIKV